MLYIYHLYFELLLYYLLLILVFNNHLSIPVKMNSQQKIRRKINLFKNISRMISTGQYKNKSLLKEKEFKIDENFKIMPL